MSLTNQTVKATYNGTGAQADFAIPFTPIVSDSNETVVYIRDHTDPNDITTTLQVEGALNDYTLTGAPDASSFDVNVTFTAGNIPTANQKVIIIRTLPLTQTLDQSTGSFNPPAQEIAFDRLSAQIQQLNEKVERCVRATVIEQLADTGYELPNPVAGNVFGWNAAGTGITHYTPAGIATAGGGGIASTSDLAEGTNLYYTQGRFNTAFAAKSTTDLAEGTNLYYTNARADARVAIGFAASYRSVVATDTATTADRFLSLSGASFTQNLFTAVGNSGKELVIKHNGTSLTQLYTIDPTGGETIGGAATFVMYTNGEALRIVSDGTNWQIMDHEAETAWTSYTPTFNGFGTPSGIVFWWRRQGDSMDIRGYFISGTATAAAARFSLPSGTAIDTAKATASGTFFGMFYAGIDATGTTTPVNTRGPWAVFYESGQTGTLGMTFTVDVDNTAFTTQNGNDFSALGESASLFAKGIPISGWGA